AALRHDRKRAAGRAADLRVEAVRDDAELADGILAEAGAGETVHLVRHVHAVHQDRRLRRVAARADDRAAVDEAEAAALALHAGRDEREALEVAIDDGERFDLLRHDVRRRIRFVYVDDRLLGGDRDGLARGRTHGHGEAGLLADAEHDLLLADRGESFERELDGVVARLLRLEDGPAAD